MKSTATLDALPHAGVSPTASPLVLIEGAPAARLRVVRYETTAPLDARRFTLGVEASGSCDRAAANLGREATLLLPFVLNDESVRFLPLAHGRITGDADTTTARRDDATLALADDWTLTVERPLTTAWRINNGEFAAVAAAGESLDIGPHANRSVTTHRVSGREAHALAPHGTRWTVGDALRSLAAWANLDISLGALPADVASAPLRREIDLAAPLGNVLAPLLADHGLVVRNELWWSGGMITRFLAIAPAGSVGSAEINLDEAIALRRVAGSSGARRWVARTAGVVVESTFPLDPAWLPSLELLPDSAMSPVTNPEFHEARDVFRKWALDLEGRLGGPAFDLAARFDGVAGPWQGAARFGACVTLGADGAPLPPLVEVSFDSGATWRAHPGVAVVLPDEFALRFDDVTLPEAFLAAARAGTLRARVTAGVRGPGVELSRWRGNALAGSLPEVVLTG